MSRRDVIKEAPSCPKCGSKNTHAIYRPEIYEFPYVCRDCNEGFDIK